MRGMLRTARAVEAGTVFHVLNRGNGRQRLFRKDADFAAFERVLAEGLKRYPVDLLTYCLMGNHWHLVLRPRTDDALGRLMGWVGVTHVRRHHEHYRTRGGGLSVESGQATAVNCRFLGNQGQFGGGAFVQSSTGTANLTNCVFSGNVADGRIESLGGGLCVVSDGTATVTNCTLYGNASVAGDVALEPMLPRPVSTPG